MMILNKLDALEIRHGATKVELAREIGRNPESVGRLFTAPADPRTQDLVAMADALAADVLIVPQSEHFMRLRRWLTRPESDQPLRWV
jgi:hypothetical protein